MVLLDHLWDDVVAGPQPERGLKHLKKVYTKPLSIKGELTLEERVVASTRGLCRCRLAQGRRERRLRRLRRARGGITYGGVCSTLEATSLPRVLELITLTGHSPTPLLFMT
ncbi:hypothetical protein Pfo_023352, partial [Paulownia fortunei]